MRYLKTYEKVSKESNMFDQYQQIIDDCLIHIKDDGFNYNFRVLTHLNRRYRTETILSVVIDKRISIYGDLLTFNTKDILPHIKDMSSHLEGSGLKLKESVYYIGGARSVQPGSIKFIGDVSKMEVNFI